LLLRHRSRVLKGVVTAHVNECWETLLTLLACVRSIPTIVLVGVQTIFKATLLIFDPDWLRRSIHSIRILRLEQKDTEVRILTNVRVPLVFLIASWDDFRRSGLDVVRRHLVDTRQTESSWNARVPDLIHLNKNVVEASARERSAVVEVCPAGAR
jgi:hypothetical protein